MIDRYDLQARIAPVVIVLIPPGMLAWAVNPAFTNTRLVAGTLSGLMLAALLAFGIRWGRAAGRRLEQDLFRKWGGIQSVAFMRFRDPTLSAGTKQFYRDTLNRLGPPFDLPTEAEESADPEAADKRISAAIDEVRRRAKASRAKFVHIENINYGFARNSLGLRWVGVGMAVASAGICAALIAADVPVDPQRFWFVVGISLALAGAWAFAVTENFVKHQSEAYAKALLETIPELAAPVRRVSRPTKGRGN